MKFLLILITRTLDDNKGFYIRKAENKVIQGLKNEIRSLKENQEKRNKNLKNNQQRIEEKLKKLLGKKE